MTGIFKKKKRKKFGEIAVEKDLVNEKQVNEALRTQKEYEHRHEVHKKIGAILMDKGMLTSDDIEMVLEEQEAGISMLAWFAALFKMSRYR